MGNLVFPFPSRKPPYRICIEMLPPTACMHGIKPTIRFPTVLVWWRLSKGGYDEWEERWIVDFSRSNRREIDDEQTRVAI